MNRSHRHWTFQPSTQNKLILTCWIASRLEAIASRLQAIAIRLEAIAIGLEAIACRLEAISLNGHVVPWVKRLDFYECDPQQVEKGGSRKMT